MISPLLPSKMLILVLAACLVWVGILSLAVLAFSGMGLSGGWILGGALVMALVAWGLVMSREIRDAVVLPDPFAQGRREAALPSEESTIARPRVSVTNRFFTGRRFLTLGRGVKSQPRKVRSRSGAVPQPAGGR